jgi:hypothetical protein
VGKQRRTRMTAMLNLLQYLVAQLYRRENIPRHSN